ncbi:WD repeat-containing protein 89 [Macrobrachium rosenbergii]|uniref:WD repeat-containing protein 89 n=1 Tax=Macrobrachium rosenbergii TaxID=79674 RepID=UPI0034D69502
MDMSEDLCSQEKLYFSTNYLAVTSASVASKEEYCTALCHNKSNDKIAVSLSDNSVAVLTMDTLQNVSEFETQAKSVTGIRYSPTDNNLLWTSSLDGTLKIWDVRTGQCEKTLETKSDDEKSCIKPLTSFDVSLNERIVCAGTELIESEVFLLFWDIRNSESLGGYSQSHSDDITQIKFHPVNPDSLASSSTDGLINVFDVSQKEEEDALMYSLNVNVTVDKLTWLKGNGKYERIGAITDIHSLQFWDIKEASPLHSFSRNDVTESIKCKSSEESYIVSIHMLEESDNPIILVGSGMDASNCLRTVKLDLSTGLLQPEASLQSKQEQRLTRAALYDGKTDSFITAGECGVVRLWKPDDSGVTRKQMVKSKSHRKKPY